MIPIQRICNHHHTRTHIKPVKAAQSQVDGVMQQISSSKIVDLQSDRSSRNIKNKDVSPIRSWREGILARIGICLFHYSLHYWWLLGRSTYMGSGAREWEGGHCARMAGGSPLQLLDTISTNRNVIMDKHFREWNPKYRSWIDSVSED